MARSKTVIDYTLEQYLEEQKFRERIVSTLEKMATTLEKLDKRLEKLENE